ncbi:MAG TPA: phosphopantothenoylcysteine decarboxylase [Steroidobacteraceae bacterium]|nr:phosphopantothenoylcysteine decarboxylase [Steroidobacteraceae bacterium]
MKAKVVVTSGATREPIDSVRFISNMSSGRTGAMISEALAARGFHVTQVAGVESVQAEGIARRESFTDHASLDTALRRLARDSACAAIIHAAAVGDFAVAEPQPDAKIASGSELSVKLQPTHKIIDRIMGYAGNPELILVGFKLTHEPDPKAQARAARDLLKRSRARFVVQNDVSTLADGEEHLFFVHENGSSRVRRYVGRDKLATALAALIEEQLKSAAR